MIKRFAIVWIAVLSVVFPLNSNAQQNIDLLKEAAAQGEVLHGISWVEGKRSSLPQ
jgi:hypothetical protein